MTIISPIIGRLHAADTNGDDLRPPDSIAYDTDPALINFNSFGVFYVGGCKSDQTILVSRRADGFWRDELRATWMYGGLGGTVFFQSDSTKCEVYAVAAKEVIGEISIRTALFGLLILDRYWSDKTASGLKLYSPRKIRWKFDYLGLDCRIVRSKGSDEVECSIMPEHLPANVRDMSLSLASLLIYMYWTDYMSIARY